MERYLVVEDWHMTGDHLGEDGHDADDDQQLGVCGTGHDEQGRPVMFNGQNVSKMATVKFRSSAFDG